VLACFDIPEDFNNIAGTLWMFIAGYDDYSIAAGTYGVWMML